MSDTNALFLTVIAGATLAVTIHTAIMFRIYRATVEMRRTIDRLERELTVAKDKK